MGKTTEKTNRKTSGQAARTKKSAAHASPSGDQAELERSFPDESEIAQLEIARLRNEGLARARELEAFIEAVPDGVAVYDIEGRVVRSNATYRHTLARFIP